MLHLKHLYIASAVTGMIVGWLSTNFVYGFFTQYNGPLPMSQLTAMVWNNGFKLSVIISLIGALIGLIVAFAIHIISKLKLPKN